MQINYSGLTLLPSELTGEFTAASPELPKDRKSTRLNSSHSQISYAVFCLKKKKAEIEDATTNIGVNATCGACPLTVHRVGMTMALRCSILWRTHVLVAYGVCYFRCASIAL